MAYADDYYDYNGYGAGADNDGILLLLSMEDRDWWISTTGYGIDAFTDYGIDVIGDEIVPDLSNGDYYSAFTEFIDLTDDFLAEAEKGNPYVRNAVWNNRESVLHIPVVFHLHDAFSDTLPGSFHPCGYPESKYTGQPVFSSHEPRFLYTHSGLFSLFPTAFLCFDCPAVSFPAPAANRFHGKKAS